MRNPKSNTRFLLPLFEKISSSLKVDSKTYDGDQLKSLNGFETLECRLLLSGSGLYWDAIDAIPSARDATSYLRTETFEPYALDVEQLKASLATAPLEYSGGTPITVKLPTPDGTFDEFSVVESPVMSAELSAQFPEIKTYSGQGLGNGAQTVRFDVTPAGFHGQVLSSEGAYYIDPYFHLQDNFYASYFASSATNSPEFHEHGIEGVDVYERLLDEHVDSEGTLTSPNDGPLQNRSGTQLRTYRTAVAATAEYTSFHGGTVAAGQAAIVTAMNRVTGIYETELSVRLELVANNATLVYTDAASDPYSNNNASALLGENQTNIDAVIGNANYDLGHVFTTGGGGLAGLGVVGIDARKAQGETGLTNPTGDAFWVDYVAHEMGHQFGGNHTFNGDSGSCAGGNRNASTAFEPGSGSTIQAYAGICGDDNLQSNSDPYFHSVSFDEMITHVDNVIPSVGTRTATGNSVPTVDAGISYTIPASTPFALTATGSDSDGDTLTYSWEQRDLGPQQDVNAGDNGSGPLFRFFTPTTDPTRTFPRLNDLLNNTTVVGETLPTTTRALNFRATVRDNRSGGGGVATDDVRINVVNTGNPFVITSPNTAVTWSSGSTETITWNVANTDSGAIGAANVNILLSINGGATYDTTLASNVPNDGSHSLSIPNLPTSQARIKVEGAGNIFFDVSNADFNIEFGVAEPCTPFDAYGYQGCAAPFEFNDISGSGTEIAFSNPNDAFVELTDGMLGGFQFEFYGNTYDNMFVSTNGLITFGSGNNTELNDNLTSGFSQAGIAALWGDLHAGLSGKAYYQVSGSGADEALTIQFEDWDYFEGRSTANSITFQVVLSEFTNTIRFNYLDISETTAGTQDRGGEATIGIKDAGTQGGNRLVFSQDNGTNEFVNSGTSVEFIDYTQGNFIGTDGDDVIVYKTAGDQHSITINDVERLLPVSLNETIMIDGGAGNDKITIFGTAADETAVLRPQMARFDRTGLDLDAVNVESITVHAGTGSDNLQLFDSPGDDRLSTNPQVAQLSGTGFTLRGEGFDKVVATAGPGNDLALLRGSTGSDRFDARGSSARVFGAAFDQRTVGFEQNVVYSGGGNDVAVLGGTIGNDRLLSKPTKTTITSGRFRHIAVDFPQVTATASGGVDVAFVYDSRGRDRFTATSTYAVMSGAGYINRVYRYDTVVAIGSTGFDAAILQDSAGDDRFTASSTTATLSGSSFKNQVRNFNTVRAQASRGYDRADLTDSRGNDRYTARREVAEMIGSGYRNQAIGFDLTTGRASSGRDVALLYDTSGSDTLNGDSASTRLYGSGYSNEAFGFDFVVAFAGTGNDVATLVDSARNDNLLARKPLTRLTGPGYSIELRYFNSITTIARNGGNDRAIMNDSNGNDQFIGSGNRAELKGVRFSNVAIGFDRVTANASRGNDSLDVGSLGYNFIRTGGWRTI